MKNIAIITARGGSKRIPRKNIKDFMGKPMIAYAIEAALESEIYDEVICVENEDAFAEGKRFAVTEGVLVGITSGAALKAAGILAAREENKGKMIVALLPDSGDRYLSTPMFSQKS